MPEGIVGTASTYFCQLQVASLHTYSRILLWLKVGERMHSVVNHSNYPTGHHTTYVYHPSHHPLLLSRRPAQRHSVCIHGVHIHTSTCTLLK